MKKTLIGLLWLIIVVIGRFEEKAESGFQRADPGTLAILAVVAGVTGTVMSVQAQRQQTASSRAAAKYNAALAQQKADEERRATKLETEARRKESRRLLAGRQAAYGKAGVMPVGTPFTLMTEAAKNEALSTLFVGREGEISARAFESRGELYGMQATGIGRAGRLAVGAELLGGVGTTIGAYAAAKKLTEKPEK